MMIALFLSSRVMKKTQSHNDVYNMLIRNLYSYGDYREVGLNNLGGLMALFLSSRVMKKTQRHHNLHYMLIRTLYSLIIIEKSK